MSKKRILIPALLVCVAAGAVIYVIKKTKNTAGSGEHLPGIQPQEKSSPIIFPASTGPAGPQKRELLKEETVSKNDEKPDADDKTKNIAPEQKAEDIASPVPDKAPVQAETGEKTFEPAAEDPDAAKAIAKANTSPVIDNAPADPEPISKEQPSNDEKAFKEPAAPVSDIPKAKNKPTVPKEDSKDKKPASAKIIKESAVKDPDPKPAQAETPPPTFREALERYVESEGYNNDTVLNDIEIDNEVSAFFDNAAGASVIPPEKIKAAIEEETVPLNKDTSEKIDQLFEEDRKKSRRQRREEKRERKASATQDKKNNAEIANEEKEKIDSTQRLSEATGVKIKKIGA